jgi:hypothetical protein
MTVVGDDLFVGNGSGSSVTELDASTGALVRVLSSPAYKFSYPQAMAVAGRDLFVANATGNSVTELDASTGALVKVLSGPAYKFNGPEATAVAGDDLFVGNGGGSSVTELDAFTGALVKVLSGPAYKFNEPQGMAVAGGDLFVANGDGNSVTELDASTGALVRVLSGPTATERASLGSFLLTLPVANSRTARAQFGLYVKDSFARRHQLLGQQVTEPAGALDGPAALGPLRRPRAQLLRPGPPTSAPAARRAVSPCRRSPRPCARPCRGRRRSSLPCQLLYLVGKLGPRQACLITVTALAPLLSHTTGETKLKGCYRPVTAAGVQRGRWHNSPWDPSLAGDGGWR